jgi:hypothetical protein
VRKPWGEIAHALAREAVNLSRKSDGCKDGLEWPLLAMTSRNGTSLVVIVDESASLVTPVTTLFDTPSSLKTAWLRCWGI